MPEIDLNSFVKPSKEASRRQASVARPTRLSRDELIAKQNERKAQAGRLAWSKLHSYRGCDPQWLDLWQLIIPNACECRSGYQQILKELPPDFSSPEAFFAWGVALHNAVNAKLGKPQITIDEAYSIWRKSDARKSENSGTIVP
jgi:hypothetical protein